MGYKLIYDSTLTSIASAIRSKKQVSDTYKPREMAAAIRGISLKSSIDAYLSGTIPYIDDSNITTARAMAFNRQSELESINLPNVTSFNERGYVFDLCPKLKVINMPKLQKFPFGGETESIASALQYKQTLTTVNFDSLGTVPKDIFNGCVNLSNVSVKGATVVGSMAFYNCRSLSKIDLPKATLIGTYAFADCSNLQTVILRATTMCQLRLISNNYVGNFTRTPIESGTGYIYVPKALLTTYQNDTYWATYANQFRAIEDYPDICG